MAQQGLAANGANKNSAKASSARRTLFRIVRPPLPTAVRADFAPAQPTWAMVTGKDPLGPTDFQAAGSTWLIEHTRGFLADDMGLGKSKQFIDAMQYIHDRPEEFIDDCMDTILIVCEASNVDTWMTELKMHAPCASYFAYRGGRTRGRDLNQFLNVTSCLRWPMYVVVSYNLFRSDIDEFEMLDWDCAVLDEGQYTRSTPLNPRTQSIISQYIHRVKPHRRYILSGTPIINSAIDLYNQLTWLGLMPLSWTEFEDMCTVIDIKVSEWTTVKKITEISPALEAMLRRLMDEHSIRRTKEQVTNIPAAVMSRVENVLTPAQSREYRELAAVYVRAVADLNLGLEPAVNPRVQQMRLRQFTSMANATSEAFLDHVHRAVENGQKVIIYTAWLETLRTLYVQFKHYGLVWIHGGVGTDAKQGEVSERQQVVDRFQNDPDARVLIATSQSCRVGLTLTAATVVMFVDDPWSPKNMQQNIDRAVRIGQKYVVNVYRMFAVMKPLRATGNKYVQTIDGQIDRMLQKKGKEADAIMEGRITPHMIADMLLKEEE